MGVPNDEDLPYDILDKEVTKQGTVLACSLTNIVSSKMLS